METESVPKTPTVARPSSSPPGGNFPGRVLVVEDEESLREVLEVLLSIEGCEVRSASDGAAALDIISTWTPALILLDLSMPGMDGLQFLRTYRESGEPRCPVLLLTGTAEPPGNLAELGAIGALRKPFNIDELLAIVAQFTDCS